MALFSIVRSTQFLVTAVSMLIEGIISIKRQFATIIELIERQFCPSSGSATVTHHWLLSCTNLTLDDTFQACNP